MPDHQAVEKTKEPQHPIVSAFREMLVDILGCLVLQRHLVHYATA
jgi:hypothetical protein